MSKMPLAFRNSRTSNSTATDRKADATMQSNPRRAQQFTLDPRGGISFGAARVCSMLAGMVFSPQMVHLFISVSFVKNLNGKGFRD